MSKYTTELRFICENYAGRTESGDANDVKTIVELACPKIFDDDIPFFDEAYRLPLEKKILMHYYTREISGEVVGIWKLWLNNRMREIMPYYNQLYKSTLIKFDPITTKKYTEDYHRDADDSGNTVSHGSSNDDATSRRLYSDTPQGGMNNVEDETYLTNITKNNNTANATADNNLATSNNSTEDYIRNVTGYDGGSASKLLKEFRDTFLNIDVRIINELGDLFFNLW